VTARARLGFHLWQYPMTEFMGKAIMVPFPEYRQSELNYLYYDAKVRNWIERHGPQTIKVTWMEGTDLASIYRNCAEQLPLGEADAVRTRPLPN
jgi:hypothetical protein